MTEENKNKFLEIFDANIQREGKEQLKEYLLKSDFFTAPASSKYHSAFEGGLCVHSLQTYHRLQNLINADFNDGESPYSQETIAICGLLHDLCKIDYYKTDLKNKKVNGEWVQETYYRCEEVLPYGHGEKSVYIINGFIRLTREEAMAINWHMGGFDFRVRGGSYSLSEAFARYPLALYLHTADLLATYIDEKRS
jgi:hypothetical protein